MEYGKQNLMQLAKIIVKIFLIGLTGCNLIGGIGLMKRLA